MRSEARVSTISRAGPMCAARALKTFWRKKFWPAARLTQAMSTLTRYGLVAQRPARDLGGVSRAAKTTPYSHPKSVQRLGSTSNREVSFTRYELLTLLRWSLDGRCYERLATSLRRWKGLTILFDARLL